MNPLTRLGRIKVGIVTHYMPPHIGGIEFVADSLYRAYLAAGFEARWVAAREPKTAAAHEDGRIRVSCWNGLERKLGVPWPVLGFEGLRELTKLVRWADLLHVHDSLYAGSAVTTLLARRASKPVILSQHIGFVKYRSALLNAIQHLAIQTVGRTVLRNATRVVFFTAAVEQFATDLLGGRPPLASFIPNGIETSLFRPPTDEERSRARRDLGIPKLARVALFVGRLVEKKGVDILIELLKRKQSHFFLIVGDGPLRTMIPEAAESLLWFPAVSHDGMAQMYQAADVFLLPSHGEGLPLAVEEAMATGLPVIVSKDETFTSTLEHKGACLAADRTVEGFSESLTRLADDPNLGRYLAERSRELALGEWSLEAMTARYVSLIRELTSRTG